jgi:sugar/nucleoside kinase (ribokinase family)
MYDIIAAGIATWDTLFSGVSSDLMEMDGLTAGGYSASSGGDAVNAGIVLGKMGMKTAVMGCVGEDDSADRIEADLKRAGVDSCLYHDPSVHTAAPVILIDETGERHLVRVPGNGNTAFCRKMMDDSVLFDARHLHIASVNMLPGLDGKPLADLFAQAHAHGMSTSMDASGDRSGKWFETIRDVIRYCDVFIPSYQEARMYAGSDDLKQIVSFFSAFPLKIFGVKLGVKGVYLTDFQESFTLPSLYQGKPVDTTGAGDSFFAAFLAAWLKGYDLKSCGLIGSAESASIMKVRGANAGACGLKEALQIIENAGETVRFR